MKYEIWYIIHFLNGTFKYAKYLQNFQKLDLYSRNSENVQILFIGICVYI